MVKAIYFLKRKDGLSVKEFGNYWRTQHAQLVRRIPELRRYVQCHTIRSVYRTREPLYDGVAELWYDDVETMRRIAERPESRAALADNQAFVDLSKMSFIVTEERIQKDGPSSSTMMHMLVFVRRKPGMEVETFQRYWRETHGPLVTQIPQLRRYVQSHVRLGAYRAGLEPVYDGVAELWFDSTDAIREAAASQQYQAVRADETNFLDVSRPIPFIITQDFVVI